MKKLFVFLAIFASVALTAQDNWMVQSSEDILTGETKTIVLSEAEVYNGCLSEPFLVIRRSKEGLLEAFVFFGGYSMDDEYNIVIRFGDGEPEVWEAMNSVDNTSVFIVEAQLFVEILNNMDPNAKVAIMGYRQTGNSSVGRWVVGEFNKVVKVVYNATP